MTRLDDLPRPDSPQGVPGYNDGTSGVTSQDQPTRRQEDFDNELFWPRPSDGRSPEGGRDQQHGQKVNVGDSERAVSVAAGAIIGLLGSSRGSLPGPLGAALALAFRSTPQPCTAAAEWLVAFPELLTC